MAQDHIPLLDVPVIQESIHGVRCDDLASDPSPT